MVSTQQYIEVLLDLNAVNRLSLKTLGWSLPEDVALEMARMYLHDELPRSFVDTVVSNVSRIPGPLTEQVHLKYLSEALLDNAIVSARTAVRAFIHDCPSISLAAVKCMYSMLYPYITFVPWSEYIPYMIADVMVCKHMDDIPWLREHVTLEHLLSIVVRATVGDDPEICALPLEAFNFDAAVEAALEYKKQNCSTGFIPFIVPVDSSMLDAGSYFHGRLIRMFYAMLERVLPSPVCAPDVFNPVCRRLVGHADLLYELHNGDFHIRDSFYAVLRVMARRTDIDPGIIDWLSKYKKGDVWLEAISNPILPRARIEALINAIISGRLNRDNNRAVAHALAHNPAVAREDLAALALVDDKWVREEAVEALKRFAT